MRQFTFILVAICVVVFILQNLFPIITDEFVLISKGAVSRTWILVTSIFLHGSAEHLVYNMFALALFGSILERVVGSRRFITLFFVTGIIASIGSAFFYEASLGASGAIMGIIGTLAILRPRMMIFAFGVPMPMIVAAGFWALIDLAGMFYPSQTANAAHIFGLGTGVIIGLVLREKFSERARPRVKIINEGEIDSWEDEYMK